MADTAPFGEPGQPTSEDAQAVVTAAIQHYEADPAFRIYVDYVTATVRADKDHGGQNAYPYDVRFGATVAAHLAWGVRA